MGKRTTIKMPVGGGMFAAGDAADIPNNCSETLKNVFVRPGPRLEKRDGWLREAGFAPATNPKGLVEYVDPTTGTSTLACAVTTAGLYYRDSVPTWNALTSASSDGDVDFCNIGYATTAGAGGNRCVVCGYIAATDIRANYYFTGTAATAPTHSVDSRCVEALGRRLFLANTSVVYNNKTGDGIGYTFENALYWTLAGGPPTAATVGGRRKVTIVNGATDTITSAKVYTTTGEVTVSWVQWFLPIDASQTIPLRMRIQSTAGTVYGEQIIELPTASGPNDWIAFYVQAKVPDATDVALKLLAGDGVRSAPVTSFYVSSDGTSPDTRAYGAHVNEGTYLQGMERPLATLTTSAQPQRIRWSEVDNADDIRVDSWLDIKDAAGPITAMKALDRLRLAVYKERAIFTYALTDSVDLPIQREGSWYEVGCVGPKALCVFENVHYFIGTREVYRFDGKGDPEPLAGDAMREAMFNQSTVAYPVIEMDRDNRELYVYVQAGKIHVYNLATKAWSYIDIAGGLNVADLLYCKANGESRREMWAALLDSANIVRLKSGQTQDNATGSASDVDAEVWFKPIQAEDELQQMTVENLTLRHEITASQSASTTTCEVSTDGGATFPYDNVVRVTVATGTGGGNPCEIPLWETGYRLTIRLVHSGLAGPTYFNLTSATATVQLQGRASLAAPTQVSNTL